MARSAAWSPAGSRKGYRHDVTTLSVFWPEPQYQAVTARWPHLVEHLGATWDEHRQRIERHCALVSREGVGVNQLPADVPGFEAFLAGRRVRRPGEDDLFAYPDLRDVTTAMVPWPPDRTAPCWCGSGRRYKQCCRRYGLGTLD
ncbi:MAG TPA: SEC-C domain-containing protein [Micromonosporaceae bacterium]|nr:SEC-C domain-containing protein [Micromonosporaceae bacterium]